jgi:transcriptional regulator with XRE-family HTH domain
LLEFPVLCAVFRHVGWEMLGRRRAIKMTQKHLAEELKLSFQQIQKYEHGISRVSAARLYEICQVLAVPIASMFEDLPLNAPVSKKSGSSARSKKRPPA